MSPYVIGQLQHEGSGFSLAAGGTTVGITNLNVDPGVSRVYGDVSVNGKQAASSAFIFQLDGRTLKPLKSAARTATLEGTKVKVSPVAAKLLNATFKTKAVKPGLLVGDREDHRRHQVRRLTASPPGPGPSGGAGGATR